MSSVHLLKSVQKIPLPIEEVWTFFSDPRNLLSITPPELNLKVTNEIYGAETYAGQVMTYKVRPLLGIPLFWMTEITHVEKGKFFVDEQRRGPYAMWHHQHHFQPIEGGVEMTDLVHYQLPLRGLGNLAHPFVRGKLLDIFVYRFQKINEVLGAWPGQEMVVEIDGKRV